MNTLDMIYKMADGNKKEAKISSFLVKLSKVKETAQTPELLLIKANALEQYFQSRHGRV